MYAKVTVVGNLGQDPETRYTKGGTMNVSFSVATNRKFTDAAGTPQDRTTWFRVTAWGKLAETMDRLTQDGHLAKGRQVLVTGRLESSEYTAQSGEKRTTLEVNADDILMVGGRNEAGGQSSGRSSEPARVAEDIDDLPF